MELEGRPVLTTVKTDGVRTESAIWTPAVVTRNGIAPEPYTFSVPTDRYSTANSRFSTLQSRLKSDTWNCHVAPSQAGISSQILNLLYIYHRYHFQAAAAVSAVTHRKDRRQERKDRISRLSGLYLTCKFSSDLRESHYLEACKVEADATTTRLFPSQNDPEK